jgi:hypothetical protein
LFLQDGVRREKQKKETKKKETKREKKVFFLSLSLFLSSLFFSLFLWSFAFALQAIQVHFRSAARLRRRDAQQSGQHQQHVGSLNLRERLCE